MRVAGRVYTVEDFASATSGTESTARNYRVTLGAVERALGKPLAAASERDILAIKKELRAKRSGPHVANLLRMFYRAAAASQDDPRLRKLAESLRLKQRVARLSQEEVLTIVDVNAMLGAAMTLRDRALIVVLWETGARIHEVLAVDLRDVAELDVKDNGGTRHAYRVFFRKVKVAGEEHAGFVLEGRDHLAAWIHVHPSPQADSPLFPMYRGERLGRHGANRLVHRLAARAGLAKRVYPHLFRHSRATHLLRLGVPETQVKRLLGWTANSTMLSRYSHLTADDAYHALLRAHGIETPKTEEFTRLMAAEGELRPVVPLIAAPMSIARRLELEDDELVRQLWQRALEDPAFIIRLREELAIP
jgi:site-specific recombinase XerD